MTLMTFMIIVFVMSVGALMMGMFVFKGKVKVISIVISVLLALLFIGLIIGIVELNANNVDVEIDDTFDDVWCMIKDMIHHKVFE